MITSQRWARLSLSEQFGHVGSEISRARHWDEKKDVAGCEKALERALELLDLTIADRRWQKRLKEIVRLREVVSDHLAKTRYYDVPLDSLEKYCIRFVA